MLNYALLPKTNRRPNKATHHTNSTFCIDKKEFVKFRHINITIQFLDKENSC